MGSHLGHDGQSYTLQPTQPRNKALLNPEGGRLTVTLQKVELVFFPGEEGQCCNVHTNMGVSKNRDTPK